MLNELRETASSHRIPSSFRKRRRHADVIFNCQLASLYSRCFLMSPRVRIHSRQRPRATFSRNYRHRFIMTNGSGFSARSSADVPLRNPYFAKIFAHDSQSNGSRWEPFELVPSRAKPSDRGYRDIVAHVSSKIRAMAMKVLRYKFDTQPK